MGATDDTTRAPAGNTPDVVEEPVVAENTQETRTALSLEGNPGPGQSGPPASDVSSPMRPESVPPGSVDDTGFTFGPTPGAETRPDEKPPRDDAAIRAKAEGLLRMSGVANPEQFVTDALKGADRLLAASPAERQAAFTEIFSAALKDHPEATPGTFSRVLNEALMQSPNSSLQIHSYGSVALLLDGKVNRPGNADQIVATAFQGDRPDSLDRDRTVYDTAVDVRRMLDESLSGLSGDQLKAFDESFGEMMGNIEFEQLNAPLANVGPRARPETAPDPLKQFQELSTLLGPQRSPQLVAQLLKVADGIAYADPADMQAKYVAAVDQITRDNPELASYFAPPLIAQALNVVTGTKDYSHATSGSLLGYSVLRDARLSTPENKLGTVAMALMETPNGALDHQAFNAAIRVTTAIRDATSRLDPAQRTPSFRQDVLATSSWVL